MIHFSKGTTLVYCDLSDCRYIKKHRLYRGKAKIERGEKYTDVCGQRYTAFNYDRKIKDGEIASIMYCLYYTGQKTQNPLFRVYKDKRDKEEVKE